MMHYQNMSGEELVKELQDLQQEHISLKESFDQYIQGQKQTERMFLDMVDKNPTSIQILDMEGYTIQVNSAFKYIFGVVPPSDYSIFKDHQLLTQGLEDLFEQIKGGKTVYFPDSNYNAHDVDPSFPDKSLWLKTTGFTLNDNNGKPDRIVLMHENITVRKLAEEALIESEEKFRTIFENSIIGISITYLDGTLKTNQAFCDIVGYSHEELSKLKWQSITHPDDLSRDQSIFESILSGEKSYDKWEKRYIKNNGNIVWVDISTTLQRVKDGTPLYFITSINDNTDRKLAQEKIREKDVQFRKLSSNVPDLIFQFTRKPDGTYHVPIASEGIRNIFGCSPEDVKDDFSPISNVIFPDDFDRVIRAIEYSAVYLTFFTCEFRVQIPGKELQWIYSKSTPEKLPDGTITWYGFNADITERKQAEESLQQKEELYRKLLEEIPDGVYKSTDDGKFVDINPAMVDILGYSNKEELMAVDIKTQLYFSPEDRESDVLIEENAEIEVYRMKKKDGSEIWVEDHGRLNLDKTTNILYHEGIIRDITQRRKAEEALRKSESIQNKMVSNIGDVIVIIDKDGINRYKSPNITRLFGWKPEELVGKSIWNTIHPVDLSSARNFVASIVNQTNSSGTSEMRYKRKDGEYVWIEITLLNLLDDQDINGLLGNYHDISERKIVENSLLNQKKTMADILEGTNAGTWDWNIQTGALVLNERWANILGFSLKELEPIDINTWANRVHHEDLEKTNVIINQHFNGELDYYDAVFRQLHKNGGWVWVNARGKVIEWTNDDKPLRMSGIHFDITERKQAEIRLIENEQMLQTVSDNFPGFVFWKDTRLNYLGCNHSNAIGAGFNNSSEMIGKNDFDMPWSATEAEKYQADDREVIETGIAKMHIIEMIHQANDQVRWLDTSKVPLRDSNGQIIGVLGVSSDITEQKKAENELLAAKEAADANSANVTAIIEGTTGSIWAFNRKYEIIYINRVFQEEFYRTFGVRLEPGLSLVDALPEPLRPFWKPRYDRVLDNEQFTVEDAIETDNGMIYIQVSFNPIVKKGQVIGGSCFGSNVTAQKLAEIELIKAKEKAEESDRLKSAFLANMSHEIRTPMNGILGFADLLKKPELTGEQQQKYINIIEKSGNRMLNIINDIIDISKIEAGQMHLELSDSNINEQIEYIYTFFKPETERKGIKLLFKNLLSSTEATIKTDREKLYAILTNLVKNAIKYTENGSIELGYEILNSNNSLFLKFYVKDTGIGIPKNRQEAIFERFIQADIADRMARQGAGLGLSITKAYLEMLGGRIWVESEEGNGSSFYFTLPYNPEKNDKTNLKNVYLDEANDGQVNPKLLNLKILIAEDDESSEILMELMVEKYAREILKVHTGPETIDACRNNPDIDLIMMDIQMPIMGGYEVTRQIRQFNKEVIIIAQTAYGLSGDKEKAIDAGCDDYISKPLDSNLLNELIKKHLNK